MIEELLVFIASFIANTMSAFAGGGAGLVQFPVLIFMGLPFSIALATHKTATVALGLGAFFRHFKNRKNIDWKFASYIMLCGVLGTILGAWIIIQTPDKLAKITLGSLTIALGLYSMFKKDIGTIQNPKNRSFLGLTIGGMVLFLLGVFNGSITSGSGLFVTMWLIIWFGLDYKNAVMYTMLLVGLFWNATGAIAVNYMGAPVYWQWIPALLIGSFIGGYVGAHFTHLKGNKWIKHAFTLVTLISGALLFVK